MTHYWWMHWFWITSWIFVLFGKVTLTTVHSNSTTEVIPANASNVRSAKSIGVPNQNPPITLAPFTNTSIPMLKSYNSTHFKTQKPSQKKADFANKTFKANISNVHQHNTTVISQNNLTDTNMNLTDNQIMINASLSAINHTDNLTYLDDANFNQSLVEHSERIAIDEDDGELSGISAAGITGITLGCVVIVGVICGISYFLYRNRSFNRPQVLNDHCSNPDSSGYIDDASVRDNSEEMYSLDNDSFLNSLEAMTIQNYWTDTVKHTKL